MSHLGTKNVDKIEKTDKNTKMVLRDISLGKWNKMIGYPKNTYGYKELDLETKMNVWHYFNTLPKDRIWTQKQVIGVIWKFKISAKRNERRKHRCDNCVKEFHKQTYLGFFQGWDKKQRHLWVSPNCKSSCGIKNVKTLTDRTVDGKLSKWDDIISTDQNIEYKPQIDHRELKKTIKEILIKDHINYVFPRDHLIIKDYLLGSLIKELSVDYDLSVSGVEKLLKKYKKSIEKVKKTV